MSNHKSFPSWLGWLSPLVLLSVALIWSNSQFTFIDDEVVILDAAAQPAGRMVHLYLAGQPVHEHPPLYDLFLHGWIRITGGRIALVRFPSIVFYLAGIWVLARAARKLAGNAAATSLLWLGALWPFGFHFGRVAAWYSAAFLLMALLTLAYVNFISRPQFGTWFAVVASGIALVYVNYYGWAVLALLAVDYLIERRSDALVHWEGGVGTLALLLMAYLPLWRAFWVELSAGLGALDSPLATSFLTGFNFYALFASESIGPWAWWLFAPACLAIATCVIIMLLQAPRTAQRYFIYFLILLLGMAVLGILATKRTLFLGAWLLLPIAATLATMPQGLSRRALWTALVLTWAIGWFGILSARNYAAPRFVEPWDGVARDAARKVVDGAGVIGNSPSFFFYLTDSLRRLEPAHGDGFKGILTFSIARSGVYNAKQWQASGRPLRRTMLLVEGVRPGPLDSALHLAATWLEQNCRVSEDSRMFPDPGYAFKQRYFPRFDQVPWRIRVRTFQCDAANTP